MSKNPKQNIVLPWCKSRYTHCIIMEYAQKGPCHYHKWCAEIFTWTQMLKIKFNNQHSNPCGHYSSGQAEHAIREELIKPFRSIKMFWPSKTMFLQYHVWNPMVLPWYHALKMFVLPWWFLALFSFSPVLCLVVWVFLCDYGKSKCSLLTLLWYHLLSADIVLPICGFQK